MKRFIFLPFIIYSLLNAVPVLAAKLELVSPVLEIGVGQEFQVDLMLDTEGQDINAVEGKAVFPRNLVELKAIYTGNSIINFWIEQPAQKNSEINFSGVIPGGFSGVLGPYWKGYRPGKIFSLIFAAKKEGSGVIEIRDTKVLLNDGKGTLAEVKISNFAYSAEAPLSGAKAGQFSIKDIDPPELFTPEIARDPNIFDGKWFLVFAAQDKVSGIDHYEALETWGREPDKNKWHVVESPLVLKDQSRASYIFVKATDKAGNKRIVVVMPEFKPWYKKPIVDMIIGLIGLVVLLLVVKWLWKKLKYKWPLI